ncbi:alpha/beta hydrolase-fold protein [Amycolatopsis vastitatis]|uniref:alpha/beta hydrolase-fold protein n=1 Tax=Amycolatopsis vastitatis TaxID=1905142 RepID=UPI0026CD67EB
MGSKAASPRYGTVFGVSMLHGNLDCGKQAYLDFAELHETHADAFLGFLTAELHPRIERDYGTATSGHGLFGYSYGGLFSLYTWLTGSTLFESIGAGSGDAGRAAVARPGGAPPGARRGGVYDVADDWTPIYDRTELEGFYLAIGTSGNQFKNAPVVGQLMTELINQVENGVDHDASPVRFRAPRTGLEIDLGAFLVSATETPRTRAR